MKPLSLSLLQINFCLALMVTLSACRSPYPPTVYDVSKRRLSHYENNYFIKILPQYTLFQSRTVVSPVLLEYIHTIADDNLRFIFNKGDRTVIGFFRWQRPIDPSLWFPIIETVNNGNLIVNETPLIHDIMNRFEMDAAPETLKLKTRKNYLLLDTSTTLEEQRIHLKCAIQPYATFKGGTREGKVFFGNNSLSPLLREDPSHPFLVF